MEEFLTLEVLGAASAGSETLIARLGWVLIFLISVNPREKKEGSAISQVHRIQVSKTSCLNSLVLIILTMPCTAQGQPTQGFGSLIAKHALLHPYTRQLRQTEQI